MFQAISSKLSKTGSKSEDDVDTQKLTTTAEIVAYIHEWTIASAGDGGSVVWECSLDEEDWHAGHVKDVNRWLDAAYLGDWDKVLKIAVESPGSIGEFANVTRMVKKGTKEDHPKLSGYTVLHQAAYHNAPEEVVKALVELGCFRQVRTTDGRSQTPYDIALSKSHTNLLPILQPPPDLIPHIDAQTLEGMQKQFEAVVRDEAEPVWKEGKMRLLDLNVMREIKEVWMPVAGMYGGFNIRFEGDKLMTDSSCRIVGGSGRTNEITRDSHKLVAEGWG